MDLLLTNRDKVRRIIHRRRRLGLDRKDEVWNGRYIIMPDPDNVHQEFVVLLSGLGSELVLEWWQNVTGFVATGSGEFVALEPALGGGGGVSRRVRLELVLDLGCDQAAGLGDGHRGGLYFFPAASPR